MGKYFTKIAKPISIKLKTSKKTALEIKKLEELMGKVDASPIATPGTNEYFFDRWGSFDALGNFRQHNAKLRG